MPEKTRVLALLPARNSLARRRDVSAGIVLFPAYCARPGNAAPARPPPRIAVGPHSRFLQHSAKRQQRPLAVPIGTFRSVSADASSPLDGHRHLEFMGSRQAENGPVIKRVLARDLRKN
jgi:hypothetical protein